MSTFGRNNNSRHRVASPQHRTDIPTRRATFSAAGYAAARPSYPPILFKRVLDYHEGAGFGTVVDLGCGHGLVARELGGHFERAVGVDPSAGMIRQASESTPQGSNITFRQSRSEDLSFLADGSVDLAVAAQAAHWFDYGKAWPELARVVRSGGSLAFWGYKDNVLIGHPQANAIFDAFCYGKDDVAPGIEGMDKYWERPGRDILRRLLRDIEPPVSDWQGVKRIVCDVDASVKEEDIPGGGEAWLRKKLTLGGFESYVRTFSAFQGWKDANPGMVSRADGGQGDLVDLLMDRVVEAEPEWKVLGDGWRDAEVETVWGTCILLAKRR
ncbi:LOW QUALITY PROTEIN: trans-aconitate 3-methyltransferase [Geosmithia morbida]|uniref:Trans-aconitate 3-methyltransferase n=1 Tax=Geosmithia morbida TaxID=1094350 RepID=A0A9P4Z4J1_9HYPO|nr:LOW QUALITY PROTEIN: trans-aconitate 3-methyltransferase [Geosmithia morbida]KAF4126524.1 LOW QUALITY PROTEIN: trans-aconitate 3-methyltransferase [Geosmithia morbida]